MLKSEGTMVVEVVPLTASPFYDLSSNDEINRTSSFPLDIHIKPCSYTSTLDLKMRIGPDVYTTGKNTSDRASIPERLTVKQISCSTL